MDGCTRFNLDEVVKLLLRCPRCSCHDLTARRLGASSVVTHITCGACGHTWGVHAKNVGAK